jgi:hypothetical protein
MFDTLGKNAPADKRTVGTGSHVEFIMKDISTVRYHPERPWDWARIAVEVSEQLLK